MFHSKKSSSFSSLRGGSQADEAIWTTKKIASCLPAGRRLRLAMTLTFLVIFAVGFLVLPNFASASTSTWSGAAGANWNDAGNWDTIPAAGYDLVFPLTPTGNKSNSNNFTADTSFNSITIEGTGYTLAGNRITLGGGVITSNISAGSNTISLAIILSANIVITSTNANETLAISGIISGAYNLTKSGAGTLTLSGANTFTLGLTIKAGTVVLSTNPTAAGTGTITIGDSSGSADAMLKSAYINNGPYANPITVAAGSNGVLSIDQGIIGGCSTLSGAIALNNNLTFNNTGVCGSGITGGITGTGNLIINNTSSGGINFSTTSINNTGTITNSGTSSATTTISAVIGTAVTGVIQNSATSKLVLSGANTFTTGLTIKAGTVEGGNASAFGGSGTGAVTIGDTSGSANATLSIGNSSSTFANPITVASGSSGNTLSITNGNNGNSGVLSGAITLNNNLTLNTYNTIGFSGGIGGTGNLIINIFSTNAVYISDGTKTINNTGTITNSGTSTGTTTISAVIGTAVTGVIQNSATSKLVLSGANTFTTGLTIKAGTVEGGNASAFGGSGTGAVTIGDTSGSANATLSIGNSSSTFANPITVASGSSGNTLSITNGNNGNSGALSGAITLNNNLTLNTYNTIGFSGGIGGTGNLIINIFSTNAVYISDGTKTINNTGTITNSGTSTGTTTISAVIGTAVTGVIQNSATSKLVLSGANTFTTGLTIKAGTVEGGNASAFGGSGTGAVTIGDTSGSANATLSIGNSSSTFANPITVASGSSGNTLSITNGNNGNSGALSGAITLNNNLTLNTYNTIGFSGGIGGTGNLIINIFSTNAVYISDGTKTINNTGTITNSGTSTGTTTISAVIGTAVTGVIQNSATSQLTLTGANTFTSGLTIKAGTVMLDSNAAAAGTGTITIGDSSGSANATLYLYAPTRTNPITVASGSSGNTLKIIGANGTHNGAITLNNNLTVANNANGNNLILGGGITGTGNLTIDGIGNSVTLQTNDINFTGTITNLGSSSAVTTISAVIGTAVTGVIQNSTTSALTLSGVNTYTGPITNSAGTLNLTQSTTYSTMTLAGDTTTTFTNGKTFNLTSLVSTGTAGHLATINTPSAGNFATLSDTAGINSVSYMSIKDSHAQGGAAWNAPLASGNVNVSGNTGWNFASSFTSTQTGAFNLGTTWGGACASSCTTGVDFPGTLDTAIIAYGHTVTLDSARTVDTLTVNGGGIFEPSTFLLTETTLSVTGAPDGTTGIINVGAATFAGSYSATPTLNAGSTVNYNLAGNQTVLQTLSYINLNISGSGTKTLGGATTVSGNLTHTAGTIDTSTYALNVAGNWVGNGNTVTGSGAGAVVLNGALQTVSGVTTFYNLTKDVSAGAADTLTFTAGSVQTISNTLTLKGASGKVLTLVSGTPGTRWVLTAPSGATYTADYLNVRDSDASRGLPINATNSTDSTNNLNWGFGVTTAPVPSGFNPANGATIASTPVITFVLDVIGDCRAATSDLGYDDMASYVNCAGDGTTNGACQMTDLGANGSKTIYISCQDVFGNKDTAGTNHSVTYTLNTIASGSNKAIIISGNLKIQGTMKFKGGICASLYTPAGAGWDAKIDTLVRDIAGACDATIQKDIYCDGNDSAGGNCILWTDGATAPGTVCIATNANVYGNILWDRKNTASTQTWADSNFSISGGDIGGTHTTNTVGADWGSIGTKNWLARDYTSTAGMFNAMDACKTKGPGWRLPNILELDSIRDQAKGVAPYSRLPNIINNYSSSSEWSDSSPFYMAFTYGYADSYVPKSTALYVRCVRGAM